MSERGHAVSADVRVPLELVIDDEAYRAVIQSLPAAERAAVHALRLELAEAEVGTEFDPRMALDMTVDERSAWREDRRAARIAMFADDPRVVRGDA